jgi:U3 small nucleolar ribonucleoprotein protein IMP4
MIITSSRKPSQQTRTFCKNLSHALGYKYVNRGKMSLRNLSLKGLEVNEQTIAVIYEMKGNPSRISFFSIKAKIKLELNISVNITKNRLNIKTKDLKIKCDKKELNFISDILNIGIDQNPINNYIHISDYRKHNSIALIEFYNNTGEKSDLKIAIKSLTQY